MEIPKTILIFSITGWQPQLIEDEMGMVYLIFWKILQIQFNRTLTHFIPITRTRIIPLIDILNQSFSNRISVNIFHTINHRVYRFDIPIIPATFCQNLNLTSCWPVLSFFNPLGLLFLR